MVTNILKKIKCNILLMLLSSCSLLNEDFYKILLEIDPIMLSNIYQCKHLSFY